MHISPGAGHTAYVLIMSSHDLILPAAGTQAPKAPRHKVHTHVQACPGGDIWQDLRLSGLEAHAGAGLQDLWCHGIPMLEQSVPEGQHPVEGTRAGAVNEEQGLWKGLML